MQNSVSFKGQASSKSSGVVSMADLLKTHQSAFVALHKGDIIKGKVTKLTSSEILLDINTKTEAVVLEKDRKILKQLLSLLKIGDTVSATVLNPESDMGYPVVSLRKFVDDTLWNRLERLQKNQEKIEANIKEATKGGFLVETAEGITGFLPHSYVSFTQNQQDLLGQKPPLVIVELNRDARKVIFSQKAVEGSEDFKKAQKLLKKGQKVRATVVNVTSFGVFVSIQLPIDEQKYVDGLIHISEISWEKLTDISHMFTQGEELEALIISFDEDARRIDLSIKKLTSDPFEEAVKHYSVDQKVTGVVTKITDIGVFLEIGSDQKNIEGLIRKDKIPPKTTYEMGQKIAVTISQIDSKKRRIIVVPVLLEKPIGYR